MSDKKLSRFTTPDERANISGINLNESDVDQFLSMMKQGLLSAASAHDAAVQDNFGLRADVSVRLSRPVNDGQGGIAEVETFTMEGGEIRASKEYIDPAKKPIVD
ncbi:MULTISPECIES: hypothetical protein [unclassified Streptomyces]|uniref:hypothetical protein n=1 Tax=unclassified Streptomyces TaxID=2593676 RepID=UPI000823C1D6|nr:MULTISPECIES: hypothetical protein [unclassified Streptomyces]MYU01445.1 hypothetical protein [Streptomyces sp. SID8350]SCK63590.1 hypothetical protein YUWDRAFT_07064 [Streptomyces sp. AmelKG-D3]